MTYAVSGESRTATQMWLQSGLEHVLQRHGHQPSAPGENGVRLVLHFADPVSPRPYRRKAQATYVVTIVEADQVPVDPMRTAYPVMIRTLSNLLLYIVQNGNRLSTYFVTLEQGYYEVPYELGQDEAYFEQLFHRLQPLASSNLIIDNDFDPDLPEELWEGDEVTKDLRWASRKIADMNLWPAPFPIQELLPPEDFRHVKRLYGIGGLSYGNLSARKDEGRFWMSASGVDKGNLERIGSDILLVKCFDPERRSIRLSVPPRIRPRRVSVDAIEHWMIYREHPGVGAIVHIHAWIDGVPSTHVNYPCGTLELAQAVADLIRETERPDRTIIGLKNHGLTITGPDLDDIFERIEGRIIPQVPMS